MLSKTLHHHDELMTSFLLWLLSEFPESLVKHYMTMTYNFTFTFSINSACSKPIPKPLNSEHATERCYNICKCKDWHPPYFLYYCNFEQLLNVAVGKWGLSIECIVLTVSYIWAFTTGWSLVAGLYGFLVQLEQFFLCSMITCRTEYHMRCWRPWTDVTN